MQCKPSSPFVLAIAAYGLLLAGCGDAFMKLTGYTHFHVTTCSDSEGPSVSTLVSLRGQRVIIISDCPTQSGHPNAPRRVSGVHVTSEGRQIPWACETTDAQTISGISVNGAEYCFAGGNTFLISSTGSEVRILQIELKDNKILSLGHLRKNNSVASDFFSESAVERVKAGHQQTWAQLLEVPVGITNSIGMKLVLIPPGEFLMGSSESEKHPHIKEIERPQHRVRITRPFYMGVCEVTRAHYRQVMQTSPGRYSNLSSSLPVDRVSWADAKEFCHRLSELPEEEAAGRVYHLPTEAQWEYAARAGTTTRYSFGDNETNLRDYAWYRGNAIGRVHQVGQKRPNGWGLYDMHGNLWEYCADWLSEGYYAESPTKDPEGPLTGSFPIVRGGCWSADAPGCRVAFRGWFGPASAPHHYGIRVVCELPAEKPDRASGVVESGQSTDSAKASSPPAGMTPPFRPEASAADNSLESQLRLIRGLAFSPDGRLLAAGGVKMTNTVVIELFHAVTRQRVAELTDAVEDRYGGPATRRGYSSSVDRRGGVRGPRNLHCLAFSSNSKTLAVATDCGVKLWDVAARKETVTLLGYGQGDRRKYMTGTQSVAFAPDGKLLATCPPLEVWDIAGKRVKWEAKVFEGGVAFSPDGKLVVTAERHNRVHLWETATGKQLAEVHGQMGILRMAAFSPDGKLLAVGGQGGVRVWGVRRLGDQFEFHERPRFVHALPPLAFSPDGKRLATGGGMAKLWDLESWQQIATVDRTAGYVAFSPDGKTLATAGRGTLRILPLDKLLDPDVVALRNRQASIDLIEGTRSGSKRAMESLAALGPQSSAAVPALRAALSDSAVNVRSVAALALGQIGPAAKAAVPDLMNVLKDESSYVRKSAARALGKIQPDDQTQQAVRNALMQAPKPKAERRDGTFYYDGFRLETWIDRLGQHYAPNEIFGRSSRSKPAEAIRAVGAAAIPSLMEALQSDDRRRRIGAADALGMFGAEAKDAQAALIAVLNDKALRHVAADSLARIAKATGGELPAALLRQLNSPDATTRLNAARAVLQIDHQDVAAQKVIRGAILDGAEWGTETKMTEQYRLRTSCCQAAMSVARRLGSKGSFAVAEIIRVLQAPDTRVGSQDDYLRTAAAETLGQVGPPASEAVPALIEGLRNSQLNVRGASALALAKVSPDRVPLELLEVLDDKDPAVRKAGYWALKGIGEKAVPYLIEALEHPAAADRGHAIQALLNLGRAAAPAIPVLKRVAIEDSSVSIRQQAAAAFNHLHETQPVRD